MGKRIILVYHSVDNFSTRLSVSPSTFREQIMWLRRHGFHARTVSDMISMNTNAPRQVAITFDDGFRSVVQNAAPVLDEYLMTATIFPIAAPIGRVAAWVDEDGPLPPLPMMTTADIRGLAERGWEVGAHTWGHHCCIARAEQDLRSDLEVSRRSLEDVAGSAVVGLAYPYGCFSETVERVVDEIGYKWACTTVPGELRHTHHRLRLPRVTIGRTTSRTRFHAVFAEPVQLTRRLFLHLGAGGRTHLHNERVQSIAFI